MASHFSCLGLTVDRESFGTMCEALSELAVEENGARVWRDPSGAGIAFHGTDGVIDCVTPFFAPESSTMWKAGTNASADDADCEHCGGADCDLFGEDGELVTRTTVQWIRYQADRAWLQRPQRFDLHVSAFAHAVSFASDRAGLDEAQARWFGERDFRLADEAFLPEGMFSPANDIGARAMALFTGRVVRLAGLKNAITGGDFLHARVATLPGEIDVVIDPTEIAGDPSTGGYALVRAWLVGGR